jgi:mRNA interferase RelE/StbE
VPYEVEFLPSAIRELTRPEPSIRRRIARRIDQLAADPRAHGSVKLRGGDDVWRARVGDYRILFLIHDAKVVVVVVRIAHRSEAYR